MNRWGIPLWLEEEVLKRDKNCVYCQVKLDDKKSIGVSRRTLGTWEHIINDESIINLDNIARCCSACNSSKGTKDLSIWMQSNYCSKHGINEEMVAEVFKRALVKVRDNDLSIKENNRND